MAASFLGQNVPAEYLMYILDIEPPPDKNDENGGVTLMPACTVRKKSMNFVLFLSAYFSAFQPALHFLDNSDSLNQGEGGGMRSRRGR